MYCKQETSRHPSARRAAGAMLALTLLLGAPASLAGCAAQEGISAYPQSVQSLYEEYESGYLAEAELIDGYKALLTQGDIDEADYDTLCNMLNQED